MPGKWIILIAVMGGVTGCSVEEIPLQERGTAHAQDADRHFPEEEAEPIDPFYLAIEAERWNVMIGNALNLKNDAPRSPSEDETMRVYRAINEGMTSLLDLREQVCRDGLVDSETCYALEVPDWAFAWEEELPSLAELQTRSDWLGAALQPFVDAVCKTSDEGDLPVECMVE